VNRSTRLLLILAALVLISQPLRAQNVDLTDNRTVEQQLERTTFLFTYVWAGLISYAESVGQTPEQVAEWIGEYGGPTWGEPGSRTLSSFVTGMFRNYNLWPSLEFEVLQETETEIQGRMNIPYAGYFGETSERYGVTLGGFQTLLLYHRRKPACFGHGRSLSRG